MAGWTVALPATDSEKEKKGDPRPSIESLYDSKETYIRKVQESTRALIEQRYILEEDFENIVDICEQKYDEYSTGK